MKPEAATMPPATDAPPERPSFPRRLQAALRTFFEIVGILQERGNGEPPDLSSFKLHHVEFRKLLTANNSFLETNADLEAALLGASHAERATIQRRAIRAVADIHSMVESFSVISGGRFPGLRDAFDRVTAPLGALIKADPATDTDHLVLDFSRIRATHGDIAGGKATNLAELANALRMKVPEGFAITTEAFRLFIGEGGIRSWIQTEHMGLTCAEDVPRVAEALRERIMETPVPKAVEDAVEEALARVLSRLGPSARFAVRSSAVGEDSGFSFAGQYLTLLNVPPEGVLPAWQEVVASLYGPEALHYRLLHGIAGEAEMAVAVIAMVDAKTSGVAFSRDPARPQSGMVLVQAVRGLGVTLVEGRASPEMILVPRSIDPSGIVRTASAQAAQLVSDPAGGLREEPLDPAEAAAPCITDDQAVELAFRALEAEAHFGCPQDIEWAVGEDPKPVILQSRPLRLTGGAAACAEPPLPGHRVLVAGGDVACPGVGFGQAVHMDETSDPAAFPEGGVLVAKRPSPRFVAVLARARAIVTDAGSTTGHMASLAREFRVPALLNARVATQVIAPGTFVTVDAASGYVYEGEVPALADWHAPEDDESREAAAKRVSRPDHEYLEQAAAHIVPLTLTDPRSARFAPEHCETLHDLARFIHEKSYEEMFGMGQRLGDARGASVKLDVFLPLDLYIVDLGGGLKDIPESRKVKPAHVVSAPFSAFLAGMLDRRIPRFGARAMDMGGLLSIMMRHATTNPEADQTFHDPCYALISDRYLNFTARVGYHFSVVDSYCGNTANKNYVSVLFRGGAADRVRRERRVTAIGEILREFGFAVSVAQDTVSARLSRSTREETLKNLEMLGRLLQFFRQMDAAMTSDAAVTALKDAFIAEDFGILTGESRRGKEEGVEKTGGKPAA